MKLNRNDLSLPSVGDSGVLAPETESRRAEVSLMVTVAAQLRRRVLLDVARPYLEIDQSFLKFNPRSFSTLKVASLSGLRVYSGRVQAITETRAVFVPTQAALRLQRRRDFRLPLARSVQVTRYHQGTPSRIRASILDLSGGGAQIDLAERLDVGEIVEFSAPMGADGYEDMISAVVLSCSPATGELSRTSTRYIARLSFDDDSGRVSLSEARRDEIVRYLFSCQREQLKLRKLLAPAEGKAVIRPRGLFALLAKVRGTF